MRASNGRGEENDTNEECHDEFSLLYGGIVRKIGLLIDRHVLAFIVVWIVWV